MTYVFFAIGIAAIVIVVFFVSGNARAKWTSEVAKDLFHLNVLVPDLADFPTNRFYSAAFNAYKGSKGTLPPSAFACDFFAWYLTEYPDAKLSNLIHEHPLRASLASLASLAESEDTIIRNAAVDAHNAVCARVKIQHTSAGKESSSSSSPCRGGF